MPGKQISDREKSMVISQYEEGWQVRKIEANAKRSQTTVMKIVKEAGIGMRGHNTVNDRVKQEVHKLYADGLSIAEIIELTGVKSSQTIYTIITSSRRKRK